MPATPKKEKKSYKVKPSAKAQRAIQNIVENGGNVSKAMVDAGYSPQTAKTPSKLTQSKSFVEFMENAGITDQKLADTLNDGLNANQVIVMGKNSGESFVDIQPDHVTRHKYLTTALKVKGIEKQSEANPQLHFHQHLENKKADYDL